QDIIPATNLYAALGNNPVNAVDPWGMWVMPWNENADWGDWRLGEAARDAAAAAIALPAVAGAALIPNNETVTSAIAGGIIAVESSLDRGYEFANEAAGGFLEVVFFRRLPGPADSLNAALGRHFGRGVGTALGVAEMFLGLALMGGGGVITVGSG